MADAFSSIINRLAQQEAAALDIYDEIIRRYAPGGAFEKRYVGELEKRKTREVGRETQQLISSGLYGTTTMAGVGRRWEEEVGGPERLKLEDIQMQRLSEAQTSKAGFIAPDYSMVAQLASQVGQGVPVARAEKGMSVTEKMRAARAGHWAWQGISTGGGGRTPTGPTGTYPPYKPAEVAPAIPMAKGEGTYYGAAYKGEAAPTPADDTAAYEGWVAEIRRRNIAKGMPSKPIMPISRWRKLIKPKM